MEKKKIEADISNIDGKEDINNDCSENSQSSEPEFGVRRSCRATKKVALKRMKTQLKDLEDEQPQKRVEPMNVNRPPPQNIKPPSAKVFDLLIPCDEEGNLILPDEDGLSSPKYVLAAKCVPLPADFRYIHPASSKSLGAKSALKSLPTKKSKMPMSSVEIEEPGKIEKSASDCCLCETRQRQEKRSKAKLERLLKKDQRNEERIKKLKRLWKSTRLKNLKLESDIERLETNGNCVEFSGSSGRINSGDSIIQRAFDKTFTDADILKATCLRNISPLAFNFVRDVMGIPLPSRSASNQKKTEIVTPKTTDNPVESRVSDANCTEADKSTGWKIGYGFTLAADEYNNYDCAMTSIGVTEQNNAEVSNSNSSSMDDLMLKLNEYKSKIIPSKSTLTKPAKKITKKEILMRRKQQKIENGTYKKYSATKRKKKPKTTKRVKERDEENKEMRRRNVRKVKANIPEIVPQVATINCEPTSIDLQGFQCQDNFYNNTHMPGFSRAENCKVYQFMQPSTARHPYIVNYPDTALHIVEEQPTQHYRYADNRYHHESVALANRPVTPIEHII